MFGLNSPEPIRFENSTVNQYIFWRTVIALMCHAKSLKKLNFHFKTYIGLLRHSLYSNVNLVVGTIIYYQRDAFGNIFILIFAIFLLKHLSSEFLTLLFYSSIFTTSNDILLKLIIWLLFHNRIHVCLIFDLYISRLMCDLY
jgi:hypothetical protein